MTDCCCYEPPSGHLIDPKTYDRKLLVNFEQDRMMSSRTLLLDRIKKLEKEAATVVPSPPVSIFEMRKTHNMPFDYSWKPSVQMVETITVLEGKREGTEYEFTIPMIRENNVGFWGFVLEVEGSFTDDDITTFSLVANGAYFDKYRRILYSKPKEVAGHKNVYHIPLEFWPKDLDRLLFTFPYRSCSILVSNVPTDVTARLIAKRVDIDQEVARVYNNRNKFQMVALHGEVLVGVDKTTVQLSQANKCMLRYGFMTENGDKIYDVLSSVDGVPIQTLCGTQKLDVNDSVIWFDLASPISMRFMLVEFARKKNVPIRFVYEYSNFLLSHDTSIVLRYS